MQTIITAINRTPRMSKKTGKPFVSVGIKTEHHGDTWLSGFASPDNADWEIGDSVEIEVTKKGDFMNFTTQKKSPSQKEEDNEYPVSAKLETILNKMTGIQIDVQIIKELLQPKKKSVIEEPEDFDPEF